MDYSQFLVMKQELALLVVFLLVFLYDTFMPQRAGKALPVVSTVLLLLATAAGFCSHCLGSACAGEAFAGMYATSPVITAIKSILNIGAVIVLIQSMS